MSPELIGHLIISATEGGGGFNWTYVGEHTVNLIILLAVLIYFLKNPVMNHLSDRRKTLGKEMEDAERDIVQAKERYEDYSQKLDGIEKEIRSLQETIRKQGEAERQEIIKQAEATSENIRKEARETIRLEAERARREIRSEIATLAMDKAENLIKNNLEQSDKKRLAQEFIESIEDGEKWHQSQH